MHRSLSSPLSRSSAPARALRRPSVLRQAAIGLAAAAAFGSASATTPLQCRHAPLAQFNGTIVDAAVATPELSTLVQLVQAAGLVGALSGPGPLTVFAPTNAAFAKVPPALLNLIGGDTALLTSVLTYHVSPGQRDPRRSAFFPAEVPTLQGQSLFLEFESGKPQVNQSTAQCTGVKTTNGVVWIIDSVLLPQFK